jgi:CDP-diacylglycerol--glycerol-3-phosphate 3-phosphatidyltransferase
MDADLWLASALVGAVALAGVAYAARVAILGRLRDPRLERAGASPILAAPVMEAAYHALGPVASACAGAGVRADAITGLSFVVAGGAAIALALGHFGLGAALAAVASLGDALDGLVARRTGTVSEAGGLLDAAVDRYEELFILGGLAIRYRAQAVPHAHALAALAGSFMVSYASAKADALGVVAPRGIMRRAERAACVVTGAALVPIAGALARATGRGPWLSDAPMLLALAAVGAGANVTAARRLAAIARAVRARAAAARPSTPPPARESQRASSAPRPAASPAAAACGAVATRTAGSTP